jgi:hypothetical protein
MATGKQLKAPILTGRAVKGPRKTRTRPEPRQYTLADLERARDRVAAAEPPNRQRPQQQCQQGICGVGAGAARLSVIESQLRSRGLLE